MKPQTITTQHKLLTLASSVRKYIASINHLPRECRPGIWLSFIGSTLAAVYYFLTIYFVDVLAMTTSSAGLLISSYGIGTIVGGYIGGYLSDKISPRLVSTLGLFGQSILFAALAKLKHPYSISIDLFILGIASYCFITSNYVAVLSYTHNEKTRLASINILNMVSNLGIGIASLIIAELSVIGYVNIFYLSGSLLLALSFYSFIHMTKPIKNISHAEFEKNNKSTMTCATTSKKPNNKGIKLALACLFFTGMIVSQLSTTYSIYLKQSFPQLGIHAFSIFFTLNTVLIVLFQNILVSQFININRLVMIGIGSLLIGTGMFMLNFPYSIMFIVLSCFVYSTGEMIFFSMVQLFCYQASNHENKGSGLGTYRMIYASSRFAGPAIGGAIYHYLGSNVLWSASGIIGVTFLLLCCHFRDFT